MSSHPFHIVRILAALLLVSIWMVQCTEEKPELVGYINLKVVDPFGRTLDSVKCEITAPNGKTSQISATNGVFIHRAEYGEYTIAASRKWYTSSSVKVNVNADPADVVTTLTPSSTFFSIRESSIETNYNEGKRDLKVESNGTWTATSDASWLSAAPSSGSGTAILSISWKNFEGNGPRIGKVTVSCGDRSHIITVRQTPAPAIVKVYGRIGNLEAQISDSVMIEFSTPVKVTAITPKSNFCISTIKSKFVGNTLSFTYDCAGLGGDYGFQITTVDETNYTRKFDVTVPFYNLKKDFNGWIKRYFVSADNEFMWVLMENPNKLMKISVRDLSIVESFTLPFVPVSMSFNPYNNSFNIFRQPCYNCVGDVLYTLDPTDGAITTLKVTPMPGDHPNYPKIFPVAMPMFDNGLGVMITTDNSGNSMARYIDASKGNLFYTKDDGVGRDEYNILKMNHDFSRLYLIGNDRRSDIDVMNKAGAIRTFKSPVAEQPHFIVPSKNDNRLFIVHYRDQFITDTESYSTAQSYMDSYETYAVGADFSYRPDESGIIYFAVDEIFRILDYENTFTKFSCSTNYRIGQLNATTDGTRLIAAGNAGSLNSTIYIFDLDEIYKTALSPTDGGSAAGVWRK